MIEQLPYNLQSLIRYCRDIVADEELEIYSEYDHDQAGDILFVVDEFNLHGNERLMQFMTAYATMVEVSVDAELPIFDYESVVKIAIYNVPDETDDNE